MGRLHLDLIYCYKNVSGLVKLEFSNFFEFSLSPTRGTDINYTNWDAAVPEHIFFCLLSHWCVEQSPWCCQDTLKSQSNGPVIQQYGDWHTGCWWVSCYIWYSEEGPKRAGAPPSPLLAVPNVTAHPSTASVPTSYCLMWQYNCLCTLKG